MCSASGSSYDCAQATASGSRTVFRHVQRHAVRRHHARLARDEFMWARRSFEEALTLDPEHEDALAGLGEVLLKFGQVEAGLRAYERTIELGYEDDVDLMLQIGRALFREGYVEQSLAYFERAVQHADDSAAAAGAGAGSA
jgi:Tfp pilus assembly protein PilF